LHTGSNPHFASVAANEKQNSLVELEDDFASLSIELLKMYIPGVRLMVRELCSDSVIVALLHVTLLRYCSRDRAAKDFARRIARGLKISVLQELLSKQTDWNLTEPLRCVLNVMQWTHTCGQRRRD
jgi:hypothetical protein